MKNYVRIEVVIDGELYGCKRRVAGDSKNMNLMLYKEAIKGVEFIFNEVDRIGVEQAIEKYELKKKE